MSNKKQNVLSYEGLKYFFQGLLNKFVSKEEGKGLSTNDFTTEEKEKLAALNTNANGTITEVVAGNGLAGGGTSGSVTINAQVDRGLSISSDKIGHSNSVTAATAQGSATKTLTFGDTFTIPTVTYDAQGHITNKGVTTMTMPANPNTDTGATSVEVTGNGNAVTTATYDAASRKLTLTKGATYNNYSHPAGNAANKTSGFYKISTDANSHVSSVTAVTKADITGLGLTAADVGALATSAKGAANGIAELDENGKVPTAQLPSYVDDVLEYATKSSFPTNGDAGKIYIDKATNLTWRWSGSTYVEISPSLALGTTSSSAFRGDYGNAAYTHAVTNKGIAKTSGLYKIATNAEGHVTAATEVVKEDITALGVPAQDTTYESITNEEIDAICGTIIHNANEVRL